MSNDQSNEKTLKYIEWLKKTLSEAHKNPKKSKEQLINMMNIGPNASYVHPRTEHIVPLLVAFGAAFPMDENINGKKVLNVFSQLLGKMSLDSFLMNSD